MKPLVYLLTPAIICIAFAFMCQMLFVRRLRGTQPDMWPVYVRLFTTFPGLGDEPRLREEFRSKIADPTTRRLYQMQNVASGVALIVTVITLYLLFTLVYYARPFA